MKALLVTGAEGFVGKHLARCCDAVAFRGDITQPADIAAEIQRVEPDRVIHLAAQSHVPSAESDPASTFHVNTLGTLQLLVALQREKFRGRMLFVSSADVYGSVPEQALPAAETLPANPANAYAVSKAAAEVVCCWASRSFDFDVVVARAFNHIGPGQSDQFAISSFARQAIRISRRTQEPKLNVGNLDVTRDFTDVRDVVRAYLLLLEKGGNGEIYNVCSGRERSIRSMLKLIIELAGIDPDIVMDTARKRRNDCARMYGSREKLEKAVGWNPEIPLEVSVEDTLEYWRHNG